MITNLPRFNSVILDQNIDEVDAKRTYPMKNFRFDPAVVWPEEKHEEVVPSVEPTMSTPVKPDNKENNPFSIPLYKRLLEDNSFNSTLDETL